MERLQKRIAESGFTSRRKAEELIKQGKVKVNGVVITTLGTKVDGNDSIEIDGKVLEQKSEKVYYLLNKPRGVVSTVKDELGRKTVVSLIPTEKRIFPVGRLDYDTTGLLLLTNDGELTNILTHPKNEIEKMYVVKMEGNLTPSEFYQLKKGIEIEGRKVMPTRLKIRKTREDSQIIEISIIEGRNHIVKKIFEQMKHPVCKLKRERYAFLTLDNLQSGEYRKLSVKEVKRLYSLK